MDIEDANPSSFATHFTFEVLQRWDSSFWIRALMNGDVAQLPCTDKSTGLCSWDEFEEVVGRAMPDNWKELCLNEHEE